MTILVSL